MTHEQQYAHRDSQLIFSTTCLFFSLDILASRGSTYVNLDAVYYVCIAISCIGALTSLFGFIGTIIVSYFSEYFNFFFSKEDMNAPKYNRKDKTNNYES